MTCWLFECSGR